MRLAQSGHSIQGIKYPYSGETEGEEESQSSQFYSQEEEQIVKPGESVQVARRRAEKAYLVFTPASQVDVFMIVAFMTSLL